MPTSVRPESLLPERVLQQERKSPWAKWLHGTVMFVDIAGFTPMAEILAGLGAEGAEILTDILNRYFTRTIATIQKAGGEVIKFSGDAILCLFTDSESLKRCMAAAASLQAEVENFRNIRTPIKHFALQIKIGIAQGDVMLAVVGDPNVRCDYLLAGPAVDRSIKAERIAKPGEIKVSPRLKHSVSVQKTKSSIQNSAYISRKSISAFLIPEIDEMVRSGFQRQFESLLQTTISFMEFSGYSCNQKRFSVDSFHNFFNDVVSCALRYGGTLSEVTMGDKGNNFLFYFGAPTPIEKQEKAALEWSLEIRDLLERSYPAIQMKIGIASGRIFSGVVGGSGRHHYTVVGDTVNLAARLTQTALANEINVSDSVWQKEKSNFDFIELKARSLKGKSRPVQVFNVRGKLEQIKKSEKELFRGRASEIEAIWKVCQQADVKPHFFVIEGAPGVGKSSLCEQITRKAEEDGWFILRARSEITRRYHSYAAWRAIFRQLNIEFPMDDAEPHHFEEYQTQQEQKKIRHHKICSEIFAKLSERKAFLYVDDLHWFDSLSVELLLAFINHTSNVKVFVLAATRPEWDKESFINLPSSTFMTLNELEENAVAAITADFLNGPPKSDLVRFLHNRTQGNPFILKTVMEYLVQNNSFLMIAGKWAIKNDAMFPENLSLEDLVTAKIRQLTFPERIYLQTAACMGPSFSLNILKRVLGSEFQSKILLDLCKTGYFQNLENEWITFRQSIMQEVIYNSLPIKRRKILHRNIGKAMEAYAGKDKTGFLQNLANQFKLANNSEKAIFYSLEASDKLMRSQSFPEACHYLKVAYELSNRRADKRKWIAGLKYSEALIYSGKLQTAFEVSRALRKRARRLKLWKVFHAACAHEFDAMRRMKNYSYLPLSLKILQSKSLDISTKVRISHLAGSAYFRLGRPNEAEYFLKRAAKLHKSDEDIAMSAYIFLASIAADRGKREDASKWIQDASRLAANANNKYQEIRIQHEWAGILSDSGETEEATKILNKLLPAAESLGAFYLIGAILTSSRAS